MNIERVRKFLLSLPHVVETRQWGDSLLYWVGDKAIGGKMCAVMALDGGAIGALVAYPTNAERYAELVEREGIEPAKYLARLKWVSAMRWDVFRWPEWEGELRAAHEITLAKLPRPARALLLLPKREQARLVAERRKVLAARAAAKALAPGLPRAGPKTSVRPRKA